MWGSEIITSLISVVVTIVIHVVSDLSMNSFVYILLESIWVGVMYSGSLPVSLPMHWLEMSIMLLSLFDEFVWPVIVRRSEVVSSLAGVVVTVMIHIIGVVVLTSLIVCLWCIIVRHWTLSVMCWSAVSVPMRSINCVIVILKVVSDVSMEYSIVFLLSLVLLLWLLFLSLSLFSSLLGLGCLSFLNSLLNELHCIMTHLVLKWTMLVVIGM